MFIGLTVVHFSQLSPTFSLAGAHNGRSKLRQVVKEETGKNVSGSDYWTMSTTQLWLLSGLTRDRQVSGSLGTGCPAFRVNRKKWSASHEKCALWMNQVKRQRCNCTPDANPLTGRWIFEFQMRCNQWRNPMAARGRRFNFLSSQDASLACCWAVKATNDEHVFFWRSIYCVFVSSMDAATWPATFGGRRRFFGLC